MKRFFTLLLLVCSAFPVYGRMDTLRHYNPGSKMIYFRDDDIREYVARFEPVAPGFLTDVYIWVAGKAGDKAQVHLFGNEGGSMVPVLRDNLTRSFPIQKSLDGIEQIHLKLPQRLPIDDSQFFISISALEGEMQLMSDSDERLPSCSTEQGAQYYYQYLGLTDGRWRSYHSAFRIDVVMVYSNEGSAKYMEDVTTSAGFDSTLSCRAIAWGDINNDSFADVVVDGRLYLNRRDGTFEDITSRAGIQGKAGAYALIDINNDNTLDILFIGCPERQNASVLFLNDGTGKFKEHRLSLPPIHTPSGFAIADLNNDGYPDIFIGQYGEYDGKQLSSYLFLNNGALGFSDISDSLYDNLTSRACRGCMWVDADNDGLLDLFVTKAEGKSGELWKNNGALSFTDIGRQRGLQSDNSFNGFGCDWGDYDNDGDMDVVLSHHHPLLLSDSNYRFSGVRINSGAPTFVLVANAETGTGGALRFEEQQAGGAWGDVNNDGILDLFMTTVSPCHYNDMYIQQPNHSFTSETFIYGMWRSTRGEDAVWVDIDNDGKLDLATGNDGFFRLFRNRSHTLNSSVQFELESGSAGRSAIGSRVTVFADGKQYTRDVVAGRGVNMQGMARVHFGLGNDTKIDSVIVQWPNGTRENFGSPAVNAMHALIEGRSSHVTSLYADPGLQVYPNPVRDEAAVSFRVAEEGAVKLTVYSLNNKSIRTLLSERYQPGAYTIKWDGKDDAGNRVASGMYLVRIQIGTRESTARIIVNE
jgi:hypothetical protein